MRRRTLVLAVALFACAAFGCQTLIVTYARHAMSRPAPEYHEGITSDLGVVFAERESGPLRLDVHRLRDAKPGPRPVVLYAFGGGWFIGEREQVSMLPFERLIDRGYVLVAADYRRAPESIFPAQIQDVKAAIRWIRANAEARNLDPERVAIFGPSAGGHLAALAGTGGDVEEIDDPDRGDDAPSTRLQAVVDFFGPTDLTVYREQHVGNGLGNSDRLFFLDYFMGGPPVENVDRARLANPITWIDRSDPPTFVIHGDADPIVPIQQSEMLVAALREANVFVQFRRVAGGDHGETPVFTSPELMEEIGDFLDAHLRVSR